MITAWSESVGHYNRWKSIGKIKTHVNGDIINHKAVINFLRPWNFFLDRKL